MKAILYSRVSTRGQADKGYSLRQQMEAFRTHADQRGYDVLEEVEDTISGSTLDRPGLNRVRELVAAGGVYVMLAQDRDRLAREPAYIYFLRQEFGEYGTKIRALSDRGLRRGAGSAHDSATDRGPHFLRTSLRKSP